MWLNLVLHVSAPVAALGLDYSSFTMHQDFGSLCARILAAGRDDIVRFSPGIQRDMQSRLWEAGLSFSNTERVELCTVWACRRQPLWWTHWTTHFIDSGFPPEMLIGFEPRPKKLIGFQIAHRFSMPIRVHLLWNTMHSLAMSS